MTAALTDDSSWRAKGPFLPPSLSRQFLSPRAPFIKSDRVVLAGGDPARRVTEVSGTTGEPNVIEVYECTLEVAKIVDLQQLYLPSADASISLGGIAHPDSGHEEGAPLALQAALNEIHNITEEARDDDEEGDAPSKETIKLAERLLRAMHEEHPYCFEIYSTPDGEITIHAPGQTGNSVRVLCHAEEGVLCLVNLDGRLHRRAVYKPVAIPTLPDGFIREALQALGRAW